MGAPLARLWRSSGLSVEVVDGPDVHLEQKVASADIVVSATGVAGLIKADWLQRVV